MTRYTGSETDARYQVITWFIDIYFPRKPRSRDGVALVARTRAPGRAILRQRIGIGGQALRILDAYLGREPLVQDGVAHTRGGPRRGTRLSTREAVTERSRFLPGPGGHHGRHESPWALPPTCRVLGRCAKWPFRCSDSAQSGRPSARRSCRPDAAMTCGRARGRESWSRAERAPRDMLRPVMGRQRDLTRDLHNACTGQGARPGPRLGDVG